jgi:uncharacterized protein YndB with AHSA1/START domain
MPSSRNDAERSLTVTRTVAAPREAVWSALTDPAQLDAWWGPDGFRNETHSMDFRVGGSWVYTMHGPDGTDYKNLMAYTDVVPLERIAYDHSDPTTDEPPFQASIMLSDAADGTLVTLKMVFPTIEEMVKQIDEVGAIEGGEQTLGRLAEHVLTM